MRLRSLDIFRGLTIAGMIIVNTPGNRTAYPLLDHAEWNGCTLADLVFPFFLFIVGTAIALSLSRRPAGAGQILKRAAVIFGLGLFLNAPLAFALCYLALWIWMFRAFQRRGVFFKA